MKALKKPNPFLKKAMSLLVVEVFLCSSILPVWASPVDFLRPASFAQERMSQDGGLLEELRSVSARDGGEAEDKTDSWYGTIRKGDHSEIGDISVQLDGFQVLSYPSVQVLLSIEQTGETTRELQPMTIRYDAWHELGEAFQPKGPDGLPYPVRIEIRRDGTQRRDGSYKSKGQRIKLRVSGLRRDLETLGLWENKRRRRRAEARLSPEGNDRRRDTRDGGEQRLPEEVLRWMRERLPTNLSFQIAEAIQLYYLEGLDNSEIAQRQETTPNNAKMRVYLGRKHLLGLMEDEEIQNAGEKLKTILASWRESVIFRDVLEWMGDYDAWLKDREKRPKELRFDLRDPRERKRFRRLVKDLKLPRNIIRGKFPKDRIVWFVPKWEREFGYLLEVRHETHSGRLLHNYRVANRSGRRLPAPPPRKVDPALNAALAAGSLLRLLEGYIADVKEALAPRWISVSRNRRGRITSKHTHLFPTTGVPVGFVETTIPVDYPDRLKYIDLGVSGDDLMTDQKDVAELTLVERGTRGPVETVLIWRKDGKRFIQTDYAGTYLDWESHRGAVVKTIKDLWAYRRGQRLTPPVRPEGYLPVKPPEASRASGYKEVVFSSAYFYLDPDYPSSRVYAKWFRRGEFEFKGLWPTKADSTQGPPIRLARSDWGRDEWEAVDPDDWDLIAPPILVRDGGVRRAGTLASLAAGAALLLNPSAASMVSAQTPSEANTRSSDGGDREDDEFDPELSITAGGLIGPLVPMTAAHDVARTNTIAWRSYRRRQRDEDESSKDGGDRRPDGAQVIEPPINLKQMGILTAELDLSKRSLTVEEMDQISTMPSWVHQETETLEQLGQLEAVTTTYRTLLGKLKMYDRHRVELRSAWEMQELTAERLSGRSKGGPPEEKGRSVKEWEATWRKALSQILSMYQPSTQRRLHDYLQASRLGWKFAWQHLHPDYKLTAVAGPKLYGRLEERVLSEARELGFIHDERDPAEEALFLKENRSALRNLAREVLFKFVSKTAFDGGRSQTLQTILLEVTPAAPQRPISLPDTFVYP